jgi:hypothetical protein
VDGEKESVSRMERMGLITSNGDLTPRGIALIGDNRSSYAVNDDISEGAADILADAFLVNVRKMASGGRIKGDMYEDNPRIAYTTTESKETGIHRHMIWIDIHGDGWSSYTNDHSHTISNSRILMAAGHTHDIDKDADGSAEVV